jgi:hypothetical protein
MALRLPQLAMATKEIIITAPDSHQIFRFVVKFFI